MHVQGLCYSISFVLVLLICIDDISYIGWCGSMLVFHFFYSLFYFYGGICRPTIKPDMLHFNPQNLWILWCHFDHSNTSCWIKGVFYNIQISIQCFKSYFFVTLKSWTCTPTHTLMCFTTWATSWKLFFLRANHLVNMCLIKPTAKVTVLMPISSVILHVDVVA